MDQDTRRKCQKGEMLTIKQNNKHETPTNQLLDVLVNTGDQVLVGGDAIDGAHGQAALRCEVGHEVLPAGTSHRLKLQEGHVTFV